MRKIDELKQELTEAKEEVRSLMNDTKMEEAETKMEEVRSLKKQIDLEGELNQEEERELEQKFEQKKQEHKEDRGQEEEVEVRSAFFKSLRGEKLNEKEERAMSSITGEDGGLIVPQDIRTQINELKRQMLSIRNYINVEPVSTKSGSRILEKLGSMTKLVNLNEYDDIADAGNPKFTKVSYDVADYAGILPIPNNLLKDTDQALLRYIYKWLTKKSVLTENSEVFDMLKTVYSTKKQIAQGKEIKDIKKIINVELDPAISSSAIIVTNQDGFNHLDSLEDGNSRPLLQPDPTDSSRKRLFGKQVVVFPNSQLPTTGTTTKKAPFLVGDLEEAVTFFDREQLEFRATDIGGTAFTKNTTDVRAIERFDVKEFDQDALVYGQIDVTEQTA